MKKNYSKYLIKQPNLFGGFDLFGYQKGELSVKEISYKLARTTIEKNHYSKKSLNNCYVNLGVYHNEKFSGVLQYGYALNPSSLHNVVPDTGNRDYLELNRMWLSDELPHGLASKIISYSIKFIKEKYINVGFIQSFADERCGKNGKVYQASNFIYYGSHQSDFYEYNGELYHKIILSNSKRKGYYDIRKKGIENFKKVTFNQFRYIYWINKKLRSKCLLTEEPFPE